MKVWKRVAIGCAGLIVLATCAAAALFKLAEHRIAARMRPPQLKVESLSASDLAYRTLDGRMERLSGTKGRVVFLNLWGTWCIQCVAEMPTVEKLYEHYKDDPRVEFLIVSRLDTPAQVRLYARSGSYDLPFYVTHDEDIPAPMQLGQYPATFIYAKDGSLAEQHTGAADWSSDSVVKFIDRLKDEP